MHAAWWIWSIFSFNLMEMDCEWSVSSGTGWCQLCNFGSTLARYRLILPVNIAIGHQNSETPQTREQGEGYYTYLLNHIKRFYVWFYIPKYRFQSWMFISTINNISGRHAIYGWCCPTSIFMFNYDAFLNQFYKANRDFNKDIYRKLNIENILLLNIFRQHIQRF